MCRQHGAYSLAAMADVFGHYAQDLAGSAAWDEVFDAAERPRSHYAALCDTLRLFSAADMAERKAGLDRAFQHAGITVDHDGPEQAWPLDLVPRLLTASEWDLIQRGVRQRVKALEGFLADVYGPQEILKDGIVPPHAVFASRGYHRVAGQFAASHGVRVHVAGVDLVRDEAGRFRVLEDNIRVPSGVSYVLENRHAMTIVLPEAFTRLLAWTGPQLVGRRALVFVHPDDQIRAIANWVAMLQSPDDQVRVRLRHRHADGTWLWFEVINLHRLADPQHGDVLGEMVEITDEMAAQEALRTRTLLLQRLTESLPMGVAQLDLARRIVYRNECLDA